MNAAAPLRLVYLEDDESAFELVRAMLAVESLDWTLVHAFDEASFRAALSPPPDVILSDFNLPTIDGMTALEIRRQVCPDTPFVFVSGALGEATAIDLLKAGVTDFVLKDALPRLVPAIRRSLAEACEHRERVAAERSLRESEERFRRLTENAPDVIFRYRFEPEPGYDYISPALERMCGYKPDEFYADPLLAGKLAHPEDRGFIRNILRTRRAPAGTHEIKWLDRDGRTVVTEQRFVEIKDDSGKVIAVEGIARDITERRRSQEQIQLLSQAVAQSPVAVAIADVQHQLVFVNDRYCEISGYAREELLGGPTILTRSDLVAPGALAAIRARVRAGGGWHGEYEIRRKDGGVRTLRSTITSIRDAAGAITHSVGVAEDITEARKEQERRRGLEAQLHQAQKMESIGVLAGGIAHDFNNILTDILGFAELGRHTGKNARAVGECLDEIRKAGLRAKDLVAQILTFSRQRESEQVPLELARVVGDALKFLRASTPATIKIERNLAAGLVRADPTQMHQVVLNLATNALQAMGGGPGTLTIAIERVNVGEALAATMPQVAPGPFLCLSVHDTGHGMDAATLSHIFDPFFTTKPTGIGTGLGLAVVQGIVRAHRGGIVVESTVARGSVFRVFLPVCASSVVEVVAAPPAVPGRGEHVLLVDDEVSVGQFAGARLEQLRYRVTTHSDPLRALAALRAAPREFDAVVSDFAMPGLDGVNFVRQARKVRPELPAVITTGNPDALGPSQLSSLRHVALVAKPFTGDELARALQSVLLAGLADGQR